MFYSQFFPSILTLKIVVKSLLSIIKIYVLSQFLPWIITFESCGK